MIATLLPYLRIARIGLITIAALAAVGYVWYLRSQVDDGRHTIATLERERSVLQSSLSTLEQQIERESSARRQVEQALQQARAATTQSRKQVKDAPPDQDGPVAPVLGSVLDGLQ